MLQTLEEYARKIPIGRDNAVSRAELSARWGVPDRTVREIIHDIREAHNGEWDSTPKAIRDFAVLSASRELPGGYWRSDDPDEIARYNREVESRAQEVLRTWQKVPRKAEVWA